MSRDRYLIYAPLPPSLRGIASRMKQGDLKTASAYLLMRLYARRRLHSPIADAGLQHNLTVLQKLLGEAIHLGRAAVVFPIGLSKTHNLGKNPASGEFTDYYDLDNSYATRNGRRQPLNFVAYNASPRIFYGSASQSPLLIGQNDVVTPLDNERYETIVRQIRMDTIPNFSYPDMADTKFDIQPREDIVRLSAGVAEKIHARHPNGFFTMQWRAPFDAHAGADADNTPIPNWLWRLDPEERERRVDIYRQFLSADRMTRLLPRIFPRGAALYIMSNVHPPYDERYFGPLREIYDIYRYYDFAEIAELMTDTPDNYRLLLVEDEILKRSIRSIRVHPMHALDLEAALSKGPDSSS